MFEYRHFVVHKAKRGDDVNYILQSRPSLRPLEFSLKIHAHGNGHEL